MFGGASSWGGGNAIGKVYVINKDRLGANSSQPKTGTLALCVEHSGDCFYNYVPLVRIQKNLFRARLKGRFGAYAFPKSAGVKLSDRNFHLLLAGETVNVARRQTR